MPDKLTHLIGNVGTEPKDKDITPTAKGTSQITEFSLGVPTQYGFGQPTDWYNVSVWEEELRDEVKKNIHKGAAIGVTGTARTRQWEGKTNHSIMAGRIYQLKRMGRGPTVPMTQYATTKPASAEQVEDF